MSAHNCKFSNRHEAGTVMNKSADGDVMVSRDATESGQSVPAEQRLQQESERPSSLVQVVDRSEPLEKKPKRTEARHVPVSAALTGGADVQPIESATVGSNSLLGLNRADQLFVGVLVTVAMALMAVHWVRLSNWGLEPVEIKHLAPLEYDARIDANAASWFEWAQLDGIGEVLARRIIEDQKINGPFVDVDELRRVKGIGPKTVEKLRPWLKVDEAAARQE